MTKISLYWKCQIIGWGIYFLFLVSFNLIEASVIDFPVKTLLGAPFLTSFTGIFVTHEMRWVIKRLRIFRKSFIIQIIQLLIITILFALVYSLIVFQYTSWLQLDFYPTDAIKQKMTFLSKFLPMLLYAIFTLFTWNLVYFLNHYIENVKEKEREKILYNKQLLELEARALRAQMNPHFIFNCMNSIKSLIQKNEQTRAINYLTTFSKLIRTIFNNSDKREITLFDELETCRLYAQLESMRFGNKFSYHFNVDKNLDVKSVQVPALIIQPFIENAIWHGIMPREEAGSVSVTVDKTDNIINCIIDDNGIGRDLSNQNKFKAESSTHESKGVKLTQSRLDLDNLLNERKASVEIIDKRNTYGEATGTKVIIQLTEY